MLFTMGVLLLAVMAVLLAIWWQDVLNVDRHDRGDEMVLLVGQTIYWAILVLLYVAADAGGVV